MSIVRKCMSDFIEIYKSEPCLWNSKCEEYSNRQLKKRAYSRLVEKLREIDPSADKMAVARKINGFRTNYRKELKKVKESIVLPSVTGERYVPRLWYFERLHFLKQFTTTPKIDRIKKENSFEETSDIMEFGDSTMDEYDETSIDEAEYKDYIEDAEEEEEEESYREPNPDVAPHKLKGLPKENGIGFKDDAEIFGLGWAAEYRKLDTFQQIIAKRAIDEILYYGRLGQLTNESAKINLS